jgi:hypothetical protein
MLCNGKNEFRFSLIELADKNVLKLLSILVLTPKGLSNKLRKNYPRSFKDTFVKPSRKG